MAQSFSNLVAEINQHLQTQFPASELVVKDHWGSSQPEFRQLIRQDLYKKLSTLNGHPTSDILDLNSIPDPKNFSVSISHCALAGGYALSSKQKKIGFDIEDFDRDVTNATKRISSAEEFLAAPHPMALWVAKEATLKALRLPLVSQAQILGWKTLDASAKNFLYEFSALQNGQGIVYQNGRLIMGLAFFPA